MKYDAKNRHIVDSLDTVDSALTEAGASYYVYVLCYPPPGELMRPFYVGIGKGGRIFAHEEEARHSKHESQKLSTIRSIWRDGGEVVRVNDSVADSIPWAREEQLINIFGLTKDDTGVLTNEQRYSPSVVVGGVELRKYSEDGNELPANFIRRDTRLIAGPRVPRSKNSVYGKICSVLEQNPGATGAELVELLLDVDFSRNKSAYSASGKVSRPWLAKYIDGGFYTKNLYIREYDET